MLKSNCQVPEAMPSVCETNLRLHVLGTARVCRPTQSLFGVLPHSVPTLELLPCVLYSVQECLSADTPPWCRSGLQRGIDIVVQQFRIFLKFVLKTQRRSMWRAPEGRGLGGTAAEIQAMMALTMDRRKTSLRGHFSRARPFQFGCSARSRATQTKVK